MNQYTHKRKKSRLIGERQLAYLRGDLEINLNRKRINTKLSYFQLIQSGMSLSEAEKYIKERKNLNNNGKN